MNVAEFLADRGKKVEVVTSMQHVANQLFLNLETPLSRRGEAVVEKKYTFRSSPEVARVLKPEGVKRCRNSAGFRTCRVPAQVAGLAAASDSGTFIRARASPHTTTALPAATKQRVPAKTKAMVYCWVTSNSTPPTTGPRIPATP